MQQADIGATRQKPLSTRTSRSLRFAWGAEAVRPFWGMPEGAEPPNCHHHDKGDCRQDEEQSTPAQCVQQDFRRKRRRHCTERSQRDKAPVRERQPLLGQPEHQRLQAGDEACSNTEPDQRAANQQQHHTVGSREQDCPRNSDRQQDNLDTVRPEPVKRDANWQLRNGERQEVHRGEQAELGRAYSDVSAHARGRDCIDGAEQVGQIVGGGEGQKDAQCHPPERPLPSGQGSGAGAGWSFSHRSIPAGYSIPLKLRLQTICRGSTDARDGSVRRHPGNAAATRPPWYASTNIVDSPRSNCQRGPKSPPERELIQEDVGPVRLPHAHVSRFIGTRHGRRMRFSSLAPRREKSMQGLRRRQAPLRRRGRSWQASSCRSFCELCHTHPPSRTGTGDAEDYPSWPDVCGRGCR